MPSEQAIAQKQKREYYAANRDKFLARAKEYREANRDTIRSKAKEYYAANRDNCLAQAKEYRSANSEKRAGKQKEYYAANRDKCLARDKEYHWANRDKILARMKERTIEKHGISKEKFVLMEEKQAGRCAICGKANRGKRLCIDHCHTSGKVRGLLCSGCNKGLGFFKDSPELLGRAISYLSL